jgi:hypothetical protein
MTEASPVSPWLSRDKPPQPVKPLRCSFCNKDQNDVRKLIAGPGGLFICDECVEVCLDILREDERFARARALRDEQERLEAAEHERHLMETPMFASRPSHTGMAAVGSVRCSLCGLPALPEEVVGVEARGVLCPGCIDAVEAALGDRR